MISKRYFIKYHYLLLAILCFSSSSTLFSQAIDNAFNLYAGAGIGSPLGNVYVSKADFKTPALFANFKNLRAISISADYQMKPYFNAGTGLYYQRFSSWVPWEGNEKFKDASASMLSFRPSIGMNTKFHKAGFFNRIKFLLKVSPVLSYTKINFGNSPFMIVWRDQQEITVSSLSTPNEWLMGLSLFLSVNYIVNNHLGLFAQPYYDYIVSNSAFYVDPKVSSTGMQIGIFLRFAHDKRYFY